VVRGTIKWIYDSFVSLTKMSTSSKYPTLSIVLQLCLAVDQSEGNPMLSMYGADVIPWAASLQKFLLRETDGTELPPTLPVHTRPVHRCQLSGYSRPFREPSLRRANPQPLGSCEDCAKTDDTGGPNITSVSRGPRSTCFCPSSLKCLPGLDPNGTRFSRAGSVRPSQLGARCRPRPYMPPQDRPSDLTTRLI
jgi:hypothetical protein